MVLLRFLMILGCFGGLGRSRRAILVPMLGDVGCKLGSRWVQEGFESKFFVQLGVLMGILAPRWQDKALQDESEGVVHGAPGSALRHLGSAGGGGVIQQGGGDLKIPELDSEV